MLIEIHSLKHIGNMKIEGGKYQVKLIPSHCHREETVVEIIAALDHLSSVSDEIFSSIQQRISSQRNEVSALAGRAAAAAEKVAQLSTSQTGFKVTSAAKYPGRSEQDDKKSSINTRFPVLAAKAIPPQGSSIPTETIEMLRCSARLLSTPVKDPSELLQNYHVRDLNAVNCNIDRLENKYEMGLGRPSADLNTVDSFLLHNSAENPYDLTLYVIGVRYLM